jgi:hypothetical protein
MSKRCQLQKEYYKTNGKYKGNGKYSDDYVKWLEDQVLALQKKHLKCGECDCAVKYPNIGCDTIKDCEKEHFPNITLRQAIAKAKPNMDKIDDVDKWLDSIR